MEVIQMILAAIIGIAILDVLLSSLFMMLGAKMAGISNATFGKSILASLGSALITWLVTIVLSIIPVIGSVLGFFVGLFFALLVIQGVYSTTMGKAFLCWIFNILAKIIAIAIAVFTFASALLSIFH